MTKILLICLLFGVIGVFWCSLQAEAKPFFFKFYKYPQQVNTMPLNDYIARKIQFLNGLLQQQINSGVNINFGIHKYAPPPPCSVVTSENKLPWLINTTTVGIPFSSTKLQTKDVPDITESMEEVKASTTDRNIDVRVTDDDVAKPVPVEDNGQVIPETLQKPISVGDPDKFIETSNVTITSEEKPEKMSTSKSESIVENPTTGTENIQKDTAAHENISEKNYTKGSVREEADENEISNEQSQSSTKRNARNNNND